MNIKRNNLKFIRLAILLLIILDSNKLNAQLLIGADYSVVSGGFDRGPSSRGIYGTLSGIGGKIWCEKKLFKKKKIALEVQLFYNQVSGGSGYDIPKYIYSISSFSMKPQETYGFSITPKFYILSDFLYLKIGYVLASSTNFIYSITSQLPPYYSTTNLASTETREVTSNRVWGGGGNFGSGIILKIYKKIYFKGEADYYYFKFEPIVTYNINNSISGIENKSQQEGFYIGFMNLNLGFAIKL